MPSVPGPPTSGRVSEGVTGALMDALVRCYRCAHGLFQGSATWYCLGRPRRWAEPLRPGVLEVPRNQRDASSRWVRFEGQHFELPW